MNAKYKIIIDYLIVSFGTFLLALGISYFLEPLNLVTGGVTGIGITLQFIMTERFGFGIPLWLTNLVINIPLLIAAALIKGTKFIKRTVYSTFFLSFSLFIITLLPPLGIKDILISAVFGGVFCGIGLGFVIRNQASTGGTDLGSIIINHFHRHLSVSKVIFVLDTVIILLGFFVFGAEKAMYAIISVFVASKCINVVLEGLNYSTAVFIISDQSALIAEKVMAELDRGVTGLYGKGAYTQKEKEVLLCVVSPKEIHKIKTLVASVDKNAFVIVTDVREALGEGFKIET